MFHTSLVISSRGTPRLFFKLRVSDLRKFEARSQNFEKRLTFVTSVCASTWNNTAPTVRIFLKFYA